MAQSSEKASRVREEIDEDKVIKTNTHTAVNLLCVFPAHCGYVGYPFLCAAVCAEKGELHKAIVLQVEATICYYWLEIQ